MAETWTWCSCTLLDQRKHWNHFKGNIWETYARWCGAYIVLPLPSTEIAAWNVELKRTEWWPSKCCSGCVSQYMCDINNAMMKFDGCFLDRFLPALKIVNRPRGHSHDQDTVHEFLGRADDRPGLQGHGDGGDQSTPGCWCSHPAANAKHVPDWFSGTCFGFPEECVK